MSITIHLSPDLERRLQETSTARGVPAEEIVVGALAESLKRSNGKSATVPHLSAAESKLLAGINQGLPEATRRRYQELMALRRAETLTEMEYRELISLTDVVELANVARLEKVFELAKLRGVAVEALMAQLGLRDPGYV